MLLKTAICDDESEELEKLNDYMIAFSVQTGIELKIDRYSSGDSLIESYKAHLIIAQNRQLFNLRNDRSGS